MSRRLGNGSGSSCRTGAAIASSWRALPKWRHEGGASLRLWRARYLVRMQAGAAEFGGLVEVVEWAEPSDLAWTSVTGITQRERWRLRERGRESGCTEVTLRLSYSVDGGLLGWVAERVAGVMVRSQLLRTLVVGQPGGRGGGPGARDGRAARAGPGTPRAAPVEWFRRPRRPARSGRRARSQAGPRRQGRRRRWRGWRAVQPGEWRFRYAARPARCAAPAAAGRGHRLGPGWDSRSRCTGRSRCSLAAAWSYRGASSA